MTSDMAVSVLLLAATGLWWRLLTRPSVFGIGATGLVTGMLFLSKMSALVILPVIGLMAIVALGGSITAPVVFGCLLSSRAKKLVYFTGAASFAGAIAILVIWMGFGFRYAAINPESGTGRFYRPWEGVLGYDDPIAILKKLGLDARQDQESAKVLMAHGSLTRVWGHGTVAAFQEIRAGILSVEQRRRLDEVMSVPPRFSLRVIEFMRSNTLLPEGYLYGLANVISNVGSRGAFLNGELSRSGWYIYFPYIILIKTPIVALIFGALSIGILARARSPLAGAEGRARLIQLIPLVALIATYLCVAVLSRLLKKSGTVGK